MDLRTLVEVGATILAGLGGAGIIIMSCASWLGKVWASRILEADRLKYAGELERLRSALEEQRRMLQLGLDKAIHVHRVHFETEFRALSDIWAKLSVLRSAMAGLRPMLDIADPDEDPKIRLARRFRTFDTAFATFIRAVDDQSPFYPKEIHAELSAALQVARREHTSVQVVGPEENKEWFKEGKTNFEALVQSADRISEMIRERVASLQVHG